MIPIEYSGPVRNSWIRIGQPRHLLAQPAEAGDRLFPGVDDRILGDADRRVAKIRLDQRREHRRDRRRQIVRIEIGLRRHRHIDRLGDAAHQRFVVAEAEAARPGAAVGDVEHLQQRRHVHFHEGVVVEALVAEIQHEMRAVRPQIGKQRGMIVEKAKAIVRQLAQRRFEPVDRLDILLVRSARCA